jgi:hypothetical protein
MPPNAEMLHAKPGAKDCRRSDRSIKVIGLPIVQSEPIRNAGGDIGSHARVCDCDECSQKQLGGVFDNMAPKSILFVPESSE